MLSIFVGISVFVHLCLFLLWFSQMVQNLLPKPPPPEHSRRILVKLVKSPKNATKALPTASKQQPLWADTSQSVETDQAQPDSPFESSKTTQASSTRPGLGNTSLPSQDGIDLPGMTLADTPSSPEILTDPISETSPEKKTQKVPHEATEENQEQGQDPKKQEPQEKKLELTPTHREPQFALTPRPHEQEQEKLTPQQQTESQQRSQSQQTASAFSYQRERNRIQGAARVGSVSSVGANASVWGRYKDTLYRAVSSRWHHYIDEHASTIQIGMVRIRFYVNSDGSITNLRIIDGAHHSSLAAVSRRSITELDGQLAPFSKALQTYLTEHGMNQEGFYDEISFTVY